MDHTPVHFEIPTNNVEKLKKFYSNLFGWKIEKSQGPLDYWTIETVPVNEQMEPLRPGINGGMYKSEYQNFKQINYISVENIDDYIKEVESLGGTIQGEKKQVPNVGWIAHALDPEGNPFAMLQPIKV